jgi:hypothetical protein
LLHLGTSHIGQQRFKLPESREQQINYNLMTALRACLPANTSDVEGIEILSKLPTTCFENVTQIAEVFVAQGVTLRHVHYDGDLRHTAAITYGLPTVAQLVEALR